MGPKPLPAARAVITTAVPRLSSLGVTGARAGVSLNVIRPGWGQSTGSGSCRPGIYLPWVQRRVGHAAHCRAPRWARVEGASVKYRIPAATGTPSPCLARLGWGNAGQDPTCPVINMFVCVDSIICIDVCMCVRCLCVVVQHTHVYMPCVKCECVHSTCGARVCLYHIYGGIACVAHVCCCCICVTYRGV